MRKVLVLAILIILAWPLSAWAGVTYYVSNANPVGSDSNNGTSTSTPWLTIAKVNSSKFNPGDSILFNSGCTWRASLVIPSSGNSSSQITFGSYGAGAKPQIFGSIQLASWTNESGNLWYASASTAPNCIWFIVSNGVITWGVAESAKASVADEYEFWYDKVNLRVYVYAATSPATRYASVESPVQNFVINNNSQNYITIQNLEVAYGNQYNIWVGYTTGWNVNNNRIHHVGFWGLVGNPGDGINAKTGVVYFGYNTIHNCGIHGICVNVDNSHTFTNGIIEHNTMYNNYHSNMDIDNPSGASFGSLTIRYNTIYEDGTFNISFYAGGLYIDGNGSTPENGIQIYNNIFYNMAGTPIVIEGNVASPVIYNNTMYGNFPGATENPSGISVISASGYSPSGVVIKNNLCQDPVFACWYINDLSYIAAFDYNLAYQSSAKGTHYAYIAGKSYNLANFAAYKAALGGTFEQHAVWANPLFTNDSRLLDTPSDFTLKSGSPAINAGVNVGLTIDYAGSPVQSVPDIGAYEFVAPITSPTGLRLSQ